MKAIELGLTIRQADLIIESLRTQLKTNNESRNKDDLLTQSNNEVIRSTMLVLKDLIHKTEKNN